VIKLLATDDWRAAVPNIPLDVPKVWVEALNQRCEETLQQLRELASSERVRIFGNLDLLNDLTEGAGSQAAQDEQGHASRSIDNVVAR